MPTHYYSFSGVHTSKLPDTRLATAKGKLKSDSMKWADFTYFSVLCLLYRQILFLSHHFTQSIYPPAANECNEQSRKFHMLCLNKCSEGFIPSTLRQDIYCFFCLKHQHLVGPLLLLDKAVLPTSYDVLFGFD